MGKPYYMAGMPKHQKVGKIADYILPLGVIGILGFLAYKFLGVAGNSATTQNNAAIDQTTASTAAADVKQSQEKGVPQTLSDSTLAGLANSIELAINSGSDPLTVENYVVQVQTDTDWFRLVQLYGTRKFNSGGVFSSCALSAGLWGCDSYDLQSSLRAFLPADKISNINTYFSDQGINAQL